MHRSVASLLLVVSWTALGQQSSALSVCELLDQRGKHEGQLIQVRGKLIIWFDPGGHAALYGDCATPLRIDGRLQPHAVALRFAKTFSFSNWPTEVNAASVHYEVEMTIEGRLQSAAYRPGLQLPAALDISAVVDHKIDRTTPRYYSLCEVFQSRARFQGQIIRLRARVEQADTRPYLISRGCAQDLVVGGVKWPAAVWMGGHNPIPVGLAHRPDWQTRIWESQDRDPAPEILFVGLLEPLPDSVLARREPGTGFGDGELFPAKVTPLVDVSIVANR